MELKQISWLVSLLSPKQGNWEGEYTMDILQCYAFLSFKYFWYLYISFLRWWTGKFICLPCLKGHNSMLNQPIKPQWHTCHLSSFSISDEPCASGSQNVCVQNEWKLVRCWNYKRKKSFRNKDSATCSGWCPCPDHTAHSHGHILQFIGSQPLSEEESKDVKDLLPSPKQIQTHQACNWAQCKDLCSCQSHVAICPPFRAVPCCHLSPRQPGRPGPSVSAWPIPWGQLSRPFPACFSHTPCLEVQIPTSHG